MVSSPHVPVDVFWFSKNDMITERYIWFINSNYRLLTAFGRTFFTFSALASRVPRKASHSGALCCCASRLGRKQWNVVCFITSSIEDQTTSSTSRQQKFWDLSVRWKQFCIHNSRFYKAEKLSGRSNNANSIRNLGMHPFKLRYWISPPMRTSRFIDLYVPIEMQRNLDRACHQWDLFDRSDWTCRGISDTGSVSSRERERYGTRLIYTEVPELK